MKIQLIENKKNIRKLNAIETAKLFGGSPVIDWDLKKGAIAIK